MRKTPGPPGPRLSFGCDLGLWKDRRRAVLGSLGQTRRGQREAQPSPAATVPAFRGAWEGEPPPQAAGRGLDREVTPPSQISSSLLH